MEKLNIILTYEEQDQSNPTVLNERVVVKSDDFDTQSHCISVLEDFCSDFLNFPRYTGNILPEDEIYIGHDITFANFPSHYERNFTGHSYELAINDSMCEISDYFMLSGYIKLSSEELITFIKNYVYVLNTKKDIQFNIQIESGDYNQREDKDDFNEEGTRIEY